MNQGQNAHNRLGWQNNQQGTGGGGGLTSLPVGNSIFVNTLGDNATALPNDLSKPYLTIEQAVLNANSGDTIYVFAGTYTVNSNIAKDGVNYYFFDCTLSVNSLQLFDDPLGAVNINVYGNAKIIHNQFNGQVFRSNNGSTYNVTIESITTFGNNALALNSGSGNFNITGFINTTFINSNIRLDGDANYRIRVGELIINSTVGICNNIYTKEQYIGDSIVIVDRIINNSATGNPITMQPNSGVGKLKVIINDELNNNQAGNNVNSESAAACFGGNLEIIGDINSAGSCFITFRFGGAVNTQIKHRGKAEIINPITTLPLLKIYNTSQQTTVDLKGEYLSILGTVFDMFVLNGNTNDFYLEGIVKHSYIVGATVPRVFLIESLVQNIFFKDLSVLQKDLIGNGIGTLGFNQNIKLLTNVGMRDTPTNQALNLIAGTQFIIDANYTY